jgi:hypothetical protein
MFPDTIVAGSCDDNESFPDEHAAYRIGTLRMGSFGTGGYGLGDIMQAAMGLVCPQQDDAHMSENSYSSSEAGECAHKDADTEMKPAFGPDDQMDQDKSSEYGSVGDYSSQEYESSEEDRFARHPGPFTGNGAPCLATTGCANVDLFASPYILFDGSDVSASVIEDVEIFHDMLHECYAEDPVLAVKNILYLGNLRDGGVKNHPSHMVALAWLWEYHPETFLSTVAPLIASNTSARDILTLFSVITFNTSFPLNRLWSGEQPDASRDAQRTTLHAEEQLLWKSLLKEVNKKSKDVVKAEPLSKTRMPPGNSIVQDDDVVAPLHDNAVAPLHDNAVAPLLRDAQIPSVLSPSVVDESGDEPGWLPLIGGVDTSPQGGVDTSSSVEDGGEDGTSTSVSNDYHTTRWGQKRRIVRGDVPKQGYSGKKKNVWLDHKFRDMWHAARAKLHARNYGFSGVAGHAMHYNALCEFVVDFFAAGLASGDKMAGKWAPTPGGAHDKAAKGVKAFELPESWGGTGGISQAIAFRMYGHLLKKSETDGVASVVLPVDEQKRFIMSKYKKQLSTLRKGWVPESLEGSTETYTQTPDLTKVTGRWLSYKRARILKSDEQKANFEGFTKKVENGEKGFTVTSGHTKPHLLFAEACKPNSGLNPEEMNEWENARKISVMQWEELQSRVTKSLALSDYIYLPIVDVSGSMNGTPMEVAKALGILLSFANDPDGPYYKTVLPFDTTCRAVTLSAGDSLDRFDRPTAYNKELGSIPWGQKTCLESAFREAARLEKNRLSSGVFDPSSKHRKLCIVIFSDMHFSSAVKPLGSGEGGMDLLKTEILKKLCLQAGLTEIPVVVYWDVAGSGTSALPADVDAGNVILMAGSSDGPFSALLSADFDNVTPLAYMIQAFDKLPYKVTPEQMLD